MCPEKDLEIQELLKSANAGNANATERLFSLVYDELRKVASNKIASGSHWTTQTTTLVHETYLRMTKNDGNAWSNSHHFFWAAARAMRDILVERARRNSATKRGGGLKRLELDEGIISDAQAPDLIELDDALRRLSQEHPTSAKIVELKFFAGLKRNQIAEMMEISESSVWREWDFARAWLLHQLEDDSS